MILIIFNILCITVKVEFLIRLRIISFVIIFFLYTRKHYELL